jgi:hypothetical protein
MYAKRRPNWKGFGRFVRFVRFVGFVGFVGFRAGSVRLQADRDPALKADQAWKLRMRPP